MLSRSGQACAQRRRIRSLDKSAGLSAPSSVIKRNIAMTSLYSRQCCEISACLIAGWSRVARNCCPSQSADHRANEQFGAQFNERLGRWEDEQVLRQRLVGP